jgi:poly(A) polymerase
LGGDRYRDLVLLSAAERAIPRARLAELLTIANHWSPPVFPLGGRDVTDLGVRPGPVVGHLLDAVHEWWQAGDFVADRGACLKRLKELVSRNF